MGVEVTYIGAFVRMQFSGLKQIDTFIRCSSITEMTASDDQDGGKVQWRVKQGSAEMNGVASSVADAALLLEGVAKACEQSEQRRSKGWFY
jgi:hypothetical protein